MVGRFDKVSGEGLLVIANFSKNMAHVDVKELENAKDSSSLVVEVVTNLLDTYNEGYLMTNNKDRHISRLLYLHFWIVM